jgi:peptide/nickel transport system permease protein
MRVMDRMKTSTAVIARLGWAVLTLFILSILIFVGMNYKSPEDIARAAIGRSATPDELHAYVQQQGLDRPLVVRYLDWLGDALAGNLGVSPVTGRPVSETIMPLLERSMILAAIASVLGISVAIWLGGMMARRMGSRKDVGVLVATVSVAATPEFVVGLGFLVLFGAWLGWLPTESATAFAFGNRGQIAVAYILPVFTVAVAIVPHLYRFVRSSVREGIQAQYTDAAELKGLSTRTVHWDFVIRNSAAPIINAAAINMVFAVGGLVAVETVMSFPGIGQEFVAAIGQGDVITVQAIALILSAIILAIFFVADMLTLAMNPRLRLSR